MSARPWRWFLATALSAACGSSTPQTGTTSMVTAAGGSAGVAGVAGAAGQAGAPDVWPPPDAPCGDGLQPDAPWPTYGRCTGFRASSPFVGPATATIRWSFPAVAGPVVSADGTLYIGSKLGLHALDPQGNEIWLSKVGSASGAALAITKSGAIAVVNGPLHLVGPDGIETWAKPGPFLEFGPFVGNGGMIYTTTLDAIHAFRPDGTVAWERPASVNHHIAVGGIFPKTGDVLLVDGPSDLPSVSGFLRLSAAGDEVWSWSGKSELGEAVSCDLFDGADTMYCGNGADVVAVSSAGYPHSPPPRGGKHLIRHDGVFITGEATGLVARSRDGAKLWESPGIVAAVLAVDGEDTVYAGGVSVTAVDSAGSVRWSLPIASQQIVLGRDHTLYVVSGDLLYAIGP